MQIDQVRTLVPGSSLKRHKRTSTRMWLDMFWVVFLPSITFGMKELRSHLWWSTLPLCQCSACSGGTRVRPSEAGNAAFSGSSPDTEDGSPSPGRCYRVGQAKRRPRISTAFWCPLCWLEGSGTEKIVDHENSLQNSIQLSNGENTSFANDRWNKPAVPLSPGWICLVRFPVAWGFALPCTAKRNN